MAEQGTYPASLAPPCVLVAPWLAVKYTELELWESLRSLRGRRRRARWLSSTPLLERTSFINTSHRQH